MATAQTPVTVAHPPHDSPAALRSELFAHSRHNRTRLREDWVQRSIAGQVLMAMSEEESFAVATSVHDSYLEVPETGSVRELFSKYGSDFELLNRVLDACEPVANRIATTVGGRSGSARAASSPM